MTGISSANDTSLVPIAVHIESHPMHASDANVREVVDTYASGGTPVIHGIRLPNFIPRIMMCSFASGKMPFRNVDPLVHLFSKAWPMRCSIRNFSEIVSNYVQKHRLVYDCMTSVLHCTLAGNYDHAKKAATFDVQRILYKHFVWHPISPGHLAAWIRQGHQHIIFTAIKEYIVYSISLVPALEEALNCMYPWDQFKQNVIDLANGIRDIVYSDISTGNDPFRNVKATNGSTKGLRCSAVSSSWRTIIGDYIAMIRNVNVMAPATVSAPLRSSIYKRMVQCPPDELYRLAEAVDVPSSVIISIKAAHRDGGWKCRRRTQAKAEFQGLTYNQQFQTHEFMHAWNARVGTVLHRLPVHILALQKAAVARTGGSSSVYVCMCCKQLRAFVVDTATASKNAWAKGNHKVLYDDYTGELYCGRKIEKSSNAQSQRLRGTGTVYWKYQQATMCRESRLVEYEMLGTLLSMNGQLYVLCTSCACIMVLRPSRYIGDVFCCVHCQYKHHAQHTTTCSHCLEQPGQLRTYRTSESTMVMCRRCRRSWMDDACLLAQMTKDDIHIAIHEKWSKNKITAAYGASSTT